MINLPVGVAALVAGAPGGPGVALESTAPGLDLLGTALATAALTALVLPLLEGRQHGWSTWTWLSLAAAPVLLAGFVVHQRRLARRGGSRCCT